MVDRPMVAMDNQQESVPRRSSFFKILLQQFFNKLPIPPAFKKHIAGDHVGGSATLLSPWGGERFQVKIRNDGDTLQFADGWKDFVEAHSLRYGYALIFRYLGNMVFSVKLYDKSTCEVPISRIKTLSTVPKIEDVELDYKEEEEQHDQPIGKRNNSFDPDHKQKRKKPRPVNLEVRGGEYMEFEMIITQSHLRKPNRVNLSTVLKNPFGLHTRRELTFMDCRGESWPVTLGIRTRGTTGTSSPYFGHGWREFADKKRFEAGDKCIFRLLADGIFRVSVVKR